MVAIEVGFRDLRVLGGGNLKSTGGVDGGGFHCYSHCLANFILLRLLGQLVFLTLNFLAS